MAKRKKLRVGFDFDGVVAYNPLRIARPFVALLKKITLRPKKLEFFCPQNAWQRFCWKIIHESSFFPAPGFTLLKKLLKEEKIEGYLLTSRYGHLEEQFYRWLKKHQADKLFKGYFLNKKDEQPHEFKERTIKKLGLDLYLDDNWDIVNYLNNQQSQPEAGPPLAETINNPSPRLVRLWRKQFEIHWIYNIFDQSINYQHKHPHLASFLKELMERFNL